MCLAGHRFGFVLYLLYRPLYQSHRIGSVPLKFWPDTILVRYNFFSRRMLAWNSTHNCEILAPCYQLIISINLLLMLDHAVEQLKFPWWGSVLYCKPHYDQLFILAGTLGSQLDQVEFPESNVRAAHWFCKDEGKHFKIYYKFTA